MEKFVLEVVENKSDEMKRRLELYAEKITEVMKEGIQDAEL